MRGRRTKAEMVKIRAGLVALAVEHAPATVRQIFYLAVSAGLIAKTEAEYKGTVIRLLGEARESGELSWATIVDHTRSFYRPTTYAGQADALHAAARYYRRDMWSHAAARVEIWCEKQTLVGALEAVTNTYDIGLYPARGYPSRTFLYDCAEDINLADKPTFIYYFGDRDPSGLNIEETIEAGLRRYAPDALIHFERLAVTAEQIERMELPTRPTKTTDTRAVGFVGGSVEVEAIPPDELRRMCLDAIEQHINGHEWRILQVAERSEREGLATLAAGL